MPASRTSQTGERLPSRQLAPDMSIESRRRRLRDAVHGAVLSGVIGTWILGGTALRLVGVPGASNWIPVPLALLVIVIIAGAWAGVIRGSSVRRFADSAGWKAWDTSMRPPYGRMYPFDAKRQVSDAVSGTWSRYGASRYVVGGRVLVHAVGLPKSYDPVQWIPNDVMRRLTVGRGRDIRLESAAVNAAFRLVTPAIRSSHAVMAPHVIELFDRTSLRHTVFSLDGAVLYSADDTLRLDVEDGAERLDFLVALAALLPKYLDPGLPSGSPQWERYFFNGRRRNIVARLACWMAIGWGTAPIGLVLAIWALRLVRQGQADNRWVAWTGLVLSAVSSATFIWAMGAVAGLWPWPT